MESGACSLQPVVPVEGGLAERLAGSAPNHGAFSKASPGSSVLPRDVRQSEIGLSQPGVLRAVPALARAGSRLIYPDAAVNEPPAARVVRRAERRAADSLYARARAG